MSKKILVVDDEIEICKLVEVVLAGEGFKVSRAMSGEEALKILYDVSPDLIIMDVIMPEGINGFELCRRIRKDPIYREVPIIMLTAKSGKVDKMMGLSAGVNEYSMKPFDNKELAARVKALLKVPDEDK